MNNQDPDTDEVHNDVAVLQVNLMFLRDSVDLAEGKNEDYTYD